MAASIIRTQKITALIVHHTVTPQLWSKEKTMANLNASPMAYDGKAPYTRIGGHDWDAIGRPDNTVGYQSGSTKITNQESMGIVLVGNFEIDTPTEYQKKWLAKTLKDLMKQYSIPRNRVFLHREVRDNATACPGAFITQRFIDILLADTMPTCEVQLAEAKRFDAEERVPQIKRLQEESRNLTQKLRDTEQIVRDKDDVIAERDRILDEKRARITELERQIEESGGAVAKLTEAKDAWKKLGEVLK